MPVRYSLPTLAMRFVGRSGGLQFQTDGAGNEAVEAVRSAVFAASPQGDPDGGPTLVCTDVGPVPGGPVIFISHCDTRDLFEQFLADLVLNLEAAGWEGRLVEAPRFEVPLVWAPAVSLVASVELDYELAASKQDPATATYVSAWWVSPERTARVLTPLVDWCLAGPGEVAAMVGMSSMPLSRTSVLPTILNALRGPYAQTHTRVIVLDPSTRAMRQLVTSTNGEVALQSRESGTSWSALHLPLRHLSQVVSGDLSNAFLKAVPSNMTGRFQALGSPPVQVPLGAEMLGFAHLEPQYLFDVHGYQVVTTHHLHRIGQLDPDRWEIEDLGNDRHAITHHELAAWLDVDQRPYDGDDHIKNRPPAPPALILDRARDDFRHVLLTQEVVAANPSPALS